MNLSLPFLSPDFISTVWNTNHSSAHVDASVRKSIADLKCDYLDVCLMHWPIAWRHTGLSFDQGGVAPFDAQGRVEYERIPIIETWRAMERLVDEGLVKSIGVSNFTAILLHDLLSQARIRPVLNQVELHPYLAQSHLLTYCQAQGVHCSAYSPLGRPARAKSDELIMNDVNIAALAQKLSADARTLRSSADAAKQDVDAYSTASLLLAWNVMRSVSVLPKSATPSRIHQNLHSVIALLQQFGEVALKQAGKGEDQPTFTTREDFLSFMNGLDRNLRYVNLALAGPNVGKFAPQGVSLFE